MTIPVQIEHGNHAITAHLHAVPRVGDTLTCAFPSSGVPKVILLVKCVSHHQVGDFDGKECREPFHISVTTDDHPDHVEQNRAALARAMKGQG